MAFIPISKNNLINLDRVDMVRVDSLKLGDQERKVIMVVVGGSAYRIEDEFVGDALPLLLSQGNNLSKQFFAV
jgi:hypothetical protein